MSGAAGETAREQRFTMWMQASGFSMLSITFKHGPHGYTLSVTVLNSRNALPRRSQTDRKLRMKPGNASIWEVFYLHTLVFLFKQQFVILSCHQNGLDANPPFSKGHREKFCHFCIMSLSQNVWTCLALVMFYVRNNVIHFVFSYYLCEFGGYLFIRVSHKTIERIWMSQDTHWTSDCL